MRYGRNVRDAYQGFAKQNYTMLDNLKLGYGGTKTEMERLLADAEKLTGVKYDISNLSDVYEAIHVIQEEMGITGTTALESSQTFTGSLASMKAAFSDMLANLATGRDIGASLDALSETVLTFVQGNLLPMVGNILTELPTVLSSAFSMAIQGLNLVADNKEFITRKLTSRKLWVAISEFVSMLIIAMGYAENTATQVAALIMAGAGAVAYIVGEGLADAAHPGSAAVPEPEPEPDTVVEGFVA